MDDLQKQLDVLRRQLEDEVVLRTELENKLTTYKEDLEFAKSNHAAVSSACCPRMLTVLLLATGGIPP